MTDRLVLSADEAYELLAFLIASAEIGVVEPAFYGPHRMLDAAGRLAAAMAPRVAETERTWLDGFARDSRERMIAARRDPAALAAFLSESAAGVAIELKRRGEAGSA